MKASNSVLSSSVLLDLSSKRNRKHKNIGLILEQIASRIYQFSYRFLGSSEPRVWQKTNAHGQTIWFVYDPTTSVRETFSSEQAVRSWLENRYYA